MKVKNSDVDVSLYEDLWITEFVSDDEKIRVLERNLIKGDGVLIDLKKEKTIEGIWEIYDGIISDLKISSDKAQTSYQLLNKLRQISNLYKKEKQNTKTLTRQLKQEDNQLSTSTTRIIAKASDNLDKLSTDIIALNEKITKEHERISKRQNITAQDILSNFRKLKRSVIVKRHIAEFIIFCIGIGVIFAGVVDLIFPVLLTPLLMYGFNRYIFRGFFNKKLIKVEKEKASHLISNAISFIVSNELQTVNSLNYAPEIASSICD